MVDFVKIKEYYKELTPLIMGNSSMNPRKWQDMYVEYFDWIKIFTPIEMNTWMALKSFGRCPMYPQYPVGNYFVDFGNPYFKIAIECDGIEWHQDKEKDKNRDIKLAEMGWRVYRITGRDTFNLINDDYFQISPIDEQYPKVLYDFYNDTIEGLVKAIAIHHFYFEQYNEEVGEFNISKNCLNNKISVPF